MRATKGVVGVLALFLCVIGGIYVGAFTTTEGAGIGAFGAFALTVLRRRLSLRVLYEVLVDTRDGAREHLDDAADRTGVFPVVTALGFDAIWFGIFVVMVVEISLITPPVGLNVFVLKAVIPEVPSGVVFRGLVPFIMMDILRVALLIAVPSLALLIPSTMRS